MKLLCQIVLIAAIINSIKCRKDGLKLVQIIYRHGDRSPHYLYATDPNSADFWVEGFGKLTMLGKYQQYSLGKFLRYLYHDFVTSNPNEVKVESSSADRCLRSAEANAASFYAPTNKWTFASELNWQPIPVRFIPKDQDMHLNPGSLCPAYNEELLNVMYSAEVKQFFTDQKEILDYLSVHSGETLEDVLSIIRLLDTLLIEENYGLIIPKWVYTYRHKFKSIRRRIYNWLIDSPILLKFRAGPVLGKIVEMMISKVNHGHEKIKVKIYSTHESKLYGVLRALRFYDIHPPPPYCSSLIFELYEWPHEKSSVRLLYLNSTTPEDVYQEPQVLILDGCTEYCSLDYFIEYTKHLIPEDLKKECSLDALRIQKWNDAEQRINERFFTLYNSLLI